MATIDMIAPAGTTTSSVQCASSNTYTVDANRFVNNVSAVDIPGLLAAGFTPAPAPYSKGVLIGSLTAANMSITTDQAISLSLAGIAPYGSYFSINEIRIQNASVSLTTAAGGFYTAASKGGTAIVAAAQVYTVLTGSTLVLAATLAAAGLAFRFTDPATLYLSLTTAQGGAATADIKVFGNVWA